ncbi:MAG: hypothetical protein NZ828_04880 [Alphaproteobacteria bacterium]|nr:hypothetical protein [Alphaproteobacteria bacterium]
MKEKADYQAQRYFYDLRQLSSYCDAAHIQAVNAQKSNSIDFYADLKRRIDEFLDEGLRYISIDAEIHKTPLHCINTHQYEHVDRKTIESINLPPYIPFHASLAPLAAEYNISQILNDSQNYITKKTHLRDSLDEPQIAGIITKDIALKTCFHQAIEKLHHNAISEIIVPYGHFQDHDVALRHFIGQKFDTKP